MINTSQTAISSKTKIVFFGNERLASGLRSTDAPILSGLIERGYNIVAIVSHYTDARSRNGRKLEVADIAAKHNIPLLLPDRPTDIAEQLAAFNAEIAVLVAYGKIIPQSIIDIFPKGIVNIHPSLLPKYRGPTPIETPILNGDTSTGVSIMQLASGMDNGPIYAQEEVPLKGTETKFELYQTLANTSSHLFFKIFPSIIDQTLHPAPQDNSKATYCHLLKKSDGIIIPSTMTTLEAERKVRAYLGFPKTKLDIFDHQIIITKAHITDTQKTPLDIQCQDGAFLSIDELIGPSGKLMTAEAFLNGYAAV